MCDKPNIVYFVADQMRADSLAHLGNPASVTPNLDRIVNEGVSFENAYCQNPVCVPSRCSFLTGLYPHTTGHRTMHFLQNEDEPNFLRTMKNIGYEVIWIGRNDIVPGNRSKEPYCDEYYDGIHTEDTKSVVHDKPWTSGFKVKEDVDTSVPGYYSHYVGKISEEQARKPGVGGNDWQCVKSALEYIERKAKQPDSKPFFLYITLTFPHPPYGCEEPWYSMIDRSKVPDPRPSALELDKPSMLKGIATKQNLKIWGEDNMRNLRATYLGMVARFDHQFGMLRDKLKECGFYDDSSIFVFSDHGDYTGDYGIVEKVQNCFDNPVVNVPLLVKPAKQFAVKPRVSKALVELVDLCETVCDMCGVQTEYVQFGKSLLPTLAGNETHKDAVFSEGGRIHGETWAMEKGHKPASPYWPRLSTQESEGPEHTKAVMCRMGNIKYVYRLYEKDELYDLDKDPLELDNRVDDPQYADILTNMKLRMLQFMVETGDIVPDRKDIR